MADRHKRTLSIDLKKTPLKRKPSQAQQTKQPPKRKPSQSSQASHLGEIKQMGKKVLKKLIPNNPMVLLKKLSAGADQFKKTLMPKQKLLPALTFQNMMAELSMKEIPPQSTFHVVNQELTQSMLFFQETAMTNHQESELMRLQTQKCYKRVPSTYFQDPMPSNGLIKLLTRQKEESTFRSDELGDYSDEVSFNLNQQVAYKMKVFINFVGFLRNIGNLADLSLDKIKAVRAKIAVLKTMIVQTVYKITWLRYRKDQIQRSLVVLNALKKMKKLQNYLFSQVQSLGKLAIGDTTGLYKQYCQAHLVVKDYCCPKMICRFWDVTYYIQRGYQDSFSRALKNYIIEIITVDTKQIEEIIRPNKQQFVTMSHFKSDLQDLQLDQSYEVEEEEVELITKHNIEKQIVAIFGQGLHKCTYPTDELCQHIQQTMGTCFNNLFGVILKNDLPKSQPEIVFLCLNSQRLKKLVQRQSSILQRSLKSLCRIQQQFPQKKQVISSYLLQIIQVTFQQIDQNLTFLLARKLPKTQIQLIRQLLRTAQQWQQLVLQLKHYPFLWKHLCLLFPADQSSSSNAIIEGLIKQIIQSRRKIMEIMISAYEQASIQGLPNKMRQDDFIPTKIPMDFYNTLGEVLYGSAFIKQIQREEKKMLSSSLLLQRNNSVMITDSDTKKMPEIQGRNIQYIQERRFELQVTQNIVSIGRSQFKLLSSTLQLIRLLHGYLEWVQQLSQNQSTQQILSKCMQLLIMHTAHVNDLVLNKQALKYGKIKSKTITGKHLLLTYSQLSFVEVVIGLMAKRFPFFLQVSAMIKGKLGKTMKDIQKRFRDFILLKIREQINKLVVDPRNAINSPLAQTKQIVNVLLRSCQLIKQTLIQQKQVKQFIGVSWCAQYLQKIKTLYKSVYKSIMSSNGTRKSKDIDWSDNLYWKMRELQYVTQHLKEIGECIPEFVTVEEELKAEQHKLDNPQ